MSVQAESRSVGWLDSDPIVHIFGQFSWHDNACIVGTRAGLEKLRNAIDQALSNNRPECTGTVFADDGEGYNIIIKPEKEWSDIPTPYTWEEAADNSHPHPLSTLTMEDKQRLYNHD